MTPVDYIILLFINITACALSYAWGYDNGRNRPRDTLGRFTRDS